jgi:hypothetical protein
MTTTVVSCTGNISFQERNTKLPTLSVKAHHLNVYVSMTPFFLLHIYNHLLEDLRCPGDPLSEDYVNTVPVMTHANLDFIGVGQNTMTSMFAAS